MILEKNNNLIHFIHIPRTAGRWNTTLLLDSGYNFLIDGGALVDGKMVYHLTYDSAKKYYLPRFWTENSFTIVRNPIDRFISSLYIFLNLTKINSLNLLEDIDYFFWVMNCKPLYVELEDQTNSAFKYYVDGILNTHSNWWVPQTDFISKNTKVWRYEDGFGNNYIEWLNDEVKLSVDSSNLHNIHYDKKIYDNKKHTISDKIKANIFEYYKLDYIKFYPEYI